MLLSRVPEIDKDLALVRAIAPSGFVVAFNLGWAGPEHLHSEYPDEWREIYEDSGYFMMDPVFHWTMLHTGHKRWSEIGLPDLRRVGEKARGFGLRYGVVISSKVNGQRSFMSAARDDREINAPELNTLLDCFERWVSFIAERPELSLGEMQVLSALRDGKSHPQIATALGISVSTVKRRARALMQKFGVSKRADVIAIAEERQYFTDQDAR